MHSWRDTWNAPRSALYVIRTFTKNNRQIRTFTDSSSQPISKSCRVWPRDKIWNRQNARYGINGSAEAKKLTDMLPGIISQLGPDNLSQLKQIGQSLGMQGKAPFLSHKSDFPQFRRVSDIMLKLQISDIPTACAETQHWISSKFRSDISLVYVCMLMWLV